MVTALIFGAPLPMFAQGTDPADGGGVDGGGAEAPETDPPLATPSLSGDVSTVVLYRDSALVTREVRVQGEATEVVVEGLPERLRPGSVFAEAGSGVSIRGVRVVTTPTDQATREDVAKIDAQIEATKREMAALRVGIEAAEKQLQAVERMAAFSHSASDADLNRGVLDYEALIELVDAASERRDNLLAKRLAAQQKMAELEAKVSKLTREKNQLSSQTPLQKYQARVFLQIEDGQADPSFRLRYSVDGCGWAPQYNVAAASDSKQVKIRYGAVITQTSGEAWRSIRLTLSTASPSVSAAGPTLAPLKIAAAASGAGLADLFGEAEDMQMMMGGMGNAANSSAMPSQMAPQAFNDQFKTLKRKQRLSEKESVAADPFANNLQRDTNLNRYAGEMQQLELQASKQAAQTLADDADEEVASQTYELKSPVTLDSRRDQQLVEIATLDLTGDLVYVATPLLSSYVYREMELQNDTSEALLRGPATVYLDDRFVGGMEVPSTASGQRFTVGLGADNQIRTRRELVDKTDSVQGGNRRVQYDYRLVLSSFKGDATAIRLIDRIPMAKNEREIQISLGETSHPLSDDALYRRVDRPLGLLRWDIEVPAEAFGSDAMDVTYQYTLELDRNQTVLVPNVADQSEKGVRERAVRGGMGGGGLGGSGQ